MALLILRGGRCDGLRFAVSREMTLGRGDADVAIEDAHVSRRHAVVRPFGSSLEIEDLESRHGTWVNGVRLKGRRWLDSGDILRIGMTEIEVRLEPSADDVTVV